LVHVREEEITCYFQLLILIDSSDIPALIIRALLRDSYFDKTMNRPKAKADAWIGFMVVENQFLRKKSAK